jgi:hypothetical protein
MPDTSTEVAIASQTLSSETTSITFSSIPATYTDLRIVFSVVKPVSGNVGGRIRFNSDTGSNYSYTWLVGNGTSATSGRGTSTAELELFTGSAVTTTNPQLQMIDIFSYAGSTFKTVLWAESSDKNGSGAVSRNVGLWRNTSAITTIQLSDSSTRNFGVGTTATLYGIL